MRKTIDSESAFFSPRLFAAFLLCAAGAWLAMISFASTPSTGTLTETSAPIAYTAGPFNQPNQSPVGAGQLDTGPRCTPTNTFPCDSFDLTLHVTSGYATTHPNAAVKVTMSWVDTGTGQSDYDLYIFKGQVPDSSLSGNTPADYQSASSANPEIASIAVTPAFADGADHHFTIKIVPFTPTGEMVTVKIEFLPGNTSTGGGGFPGFGGTDPTVAGNPRYLNFYAPNGTSAQPASGEFNIGFDPITHRIMVMNIGPIWRLTPGEVQMPAKPECCEALWEDKDNATTNTGLDPILWTDQTSGRTFVSNSTAGANAAFGFTDAAAPFNDGDQWVPVSGSPPNGGADHETIGSGPYPALLSALGNAVNHGEAVYYCSQDVVGPAACQRSDDLGANFVTVGGPPYDGTTGPGCGGLHGHIHVAPDGTAWLPVNQCNGTQGGAFSTTAGMPSVAALTGWTQFIVKKTVADANGPAFEAKSQIQGADPSIAIDANNTVYYTYVNNEPVAAGNPLEGHARVAVGTLNTTTGVITWTRTFDLGATHGIVNAAEIEAVGGSNGRAAVGFLGTDTPGDYQALSFTGKWYAFVSSTFDGGATWTTVNATPNDPVQNATGIWQQGGGAQDRNLLDFTEITVDDKGNVLYGYSDGCTSPSCVSGAGPNDFTAWMRVARQSGGRSIFASHDSATDLPSAPRAPKAPCLSGIRDNQGSHLSWKVPDNGGADITSYQILRSTTAGTESLIATYSVGPTSKAEYVDTTVLTTVPDYFYQIIAVNSVSPGTASNEVDLPIVVPPVPQSPCIVPGVTVLTDPSGDSTSPEPGTDMLSASIAQPFASSDANIQLVFTIKTDPAASSVHPVGSAWYLAMKVPGATAGTFRYVGVRMEGGATNTFFWYVPGANTSGGVDGRFVNSKTSAPGSYDPTTGTITITVLASDLGLSVGSTILGFVSGSTQTTDPTEMVAGATEVWDPMPDSLAFVGSYTVASNQTCRPNTAPTAMLTATPTSGFAPLTVNFSGAGSFDPDTAPPADTIASYSFNFGDGNSATQSTATISHQYMNPGTYPASLVVTDSRGASSTNSATKTITVNGQPDLIVSTLTTSNNQAPQGSKVTFTATIKNQGPVAAGASTTQFKDGNTVLGSVSTAAIPAGQSVTVTFNWYTASAKKGTHTITATADSGKVVAESNENNNTKTITVSIQGNKT